MTCNNVGFSSIFNYFTIFHYFNCRTGELLAEYKIPLVSQLTSATFGGPNLDILFVTTASKDGDHPAEAGHLYKFTGLRTFGTPGIKVKV